MTKKKKNRRGRRISKSHEGLKQSMRQRIAMPSIVKGASISQDITVRSSMLSTLGIDKRYQRMFIKSKVDLLITVIKEGGLIEPIAVVKRPDGSYWIVDGQQRWEAHCKTGTDIRARVYSIDVGGNAGLDIERRLHNALNNNTKQSPPCVLKSHPGIGAQLLRRRNDDEGNSLYRRVQLETGTRRGNVAATALVHGMLEALGCKAPGSMNDHALPRLDARLNEKGNIDRVERYLDLVGMVFPASDKYRMPMPLAVRALGAVCYLKWKDRPPTLPTTRSIASMRRVDWSKVCPSSAWRFLPVAVGEILSRWKEAK
jgi:hypothetical protein